MSVQPEIATPPEGTPEPEAVAQDQPPPGPTRRERRARRGLPAVPVLGPQAGRRQPVPPARRDYAARRRG
jgi:hypothetical protein